MDYETTFNETLFNGTFFNETSFNETNFNETIYDEPSYCELDPSYYSWYTEYDQGHLVPKSFKIGLYFGIQIAILFNQRSAIFRKAWGKMPFIIQVLFTLSATVWAIIEYTTIDQSTFWILVLGIMLDVLTKVSVIYFICIRLIIIAPLENSRGLLVLCKLLVFLGLVIATVTIIPNMLWLSISDEDYNYWIQFYFLTDNYISFIEILTIYLYIDKKFSCKTLKDAWDEIVKLNLKTDMITVIASATFSLFLTILQFSLDKNPDYDYHFYNIATALKYTSSCNVVVALFQKSLMSKAGGNSVSKSRSDSVSKSHQLKSVG